MYGNRSDGGGTADELAPLLLPEPLREPLHAACGQPLGPAVELTTDQPVVSKRWFACDDQGRKVLRAFGAHPSALAIDFASSEFRTYQVDGQGKLRRIGAGCGTGLSFGGFSMKRQPRPLPPTPVPPVPQAVTSDVVALQLIPDGAAHRKVELPVRVFSNAPSLLLDGARFVALEVSDLRAPRPGPLPGPPPIEYELAPSFYRAEQALLVEIQSERGRRCGGTNSTWCESTVTFSKLAMLWGPRQRAKQAGINYSFKNDSASSSFLARGLPVGQPLILLVARAPRAGRLSAAVLPGEERSVTFARLLHEAKTSGRVSGELRAIFAAHPDFSELESAPTLVWASPGMPSNPRRNDDGCLVSGLYQARYAYRGNWPADAVGSVRFLPHVRLDGKPDDNILLAFRINGSELEALRVWHYTQDRALAASVATDTPLDVPLGYQRPFQYQFRPKRYPP